MNFLYQIINVVYKKSKSVLLDVLIPLYQRYMLQRIRHLIDTDMTVLVHGLPNSTRRQTLYFANGFYFFL